MRSTWLLRLAMVLLASNAGSASAQEFYAAPRDFVVQTACDATSSIRSGANPTPVLPGTTYVARGINRPADPTHVFVRVGSESKWLALTCGRFADGLAATAAGTAIPMPPPPGPGRAACLPFFDDETNLVQVFFGGLVDITPKPPMLNEFDKAVNAVCGAPGRKVTRDAFITLMRAHPAVLERVRVFTGNRVFPGKPALASADAYLADLTDAWFGSEGFEHIFCGQPSATGGGKIGGLHFRGRYLQLQQSGEACRISNFDQNEVVDGAVYTMGVIIRMPDGRIVRDARKGYGLTMDAEDLLKAVTKGFADNPRPADKKACLLAVADDGKAFTAVFVRRPAGVVTFYPDATPNGPGSRERLEPCATRVSLQ
jgi:hypothetical protein